MNAHISDPNVLDAAAQNPQNFEQHPRSCPRHRGPGGPGPPLQKPYSFEGETYTEVDLSGLEDLSAADLCKVGKMVKKIDGVDPIAEMSLPYAIFMAARVTGKPLEFFQQLPAREAIKLKNLVTGFLYGEVGEE